MADTVKSMKSAKSMRIVGPRLIKLLDLRTALLQAQVLIHRLEGLLQGPNVVRTPKGLRLLQKQREPLRCEPGDALA